MTARAAIASSVAMVPPILWPSRKIGLPPVPAAREEGVKVVEVLVGRADEDAAAAGLAVATQVKRVDGVAAFRQQGADVLRSGRCARRSRGR